MSGRELKVHLVFVAQRFTAEAAGGGTKGAAVRMNAGIRILAGYDDDTWKMLVGKNVPMPPPSKHAGRIQVFVKGRDRHRGADGVLHPRRDAPVRRVGHRPRPGEAAAPDPVPSPAGVTDPVPAETMTGGGDGAAVIVTPVPQLPPPVRNWMTIRQARDTGLLPRTWKNPYGAFGTPRTGREGRIPVPEVKGMKGTEAMYDAIELADFLERIAA